MRRSHPQRSCRLFRVGLSLVRRRLDEKTEPARRHPHLGAILNGAGEYLLGERILQLALYRPLQRSCAVDRVVSLFSQPCLRVRIDVEPDLASVEQLLEVRKRAC
jgi:hypothetical protein